MGKNKNPEFKMTPALERFKYEVAQEIGISDRLKDNKTIMKVKKGKLNKNS